MRTLTVQETEIVSGGLLGILGVAGIASIATGGAVALAGAVLAPITLGITLPFGLAGAGVLGVVGVAMIGASLVIPGL